MVRNFFVFSTLPFLILSSHSAFAGDDAPQETSAAKASQNPVANIISLPFEFWHHDGLADGEADAELLVVKPVYPVTIGSVNLINRFILPYVGLDKNTQDSILGEVDVPPTFSRKDGLANFQYQGFFSSANPGKVIWGVGPVFEFPTHSNDLGSEKWSAGPTAVVLSMPGKWVIGALIQNIWSFAGPSEAEDVNDFTFQYFINYNFDNGWYLTSTPILSANWERDSGDQWTVPFGGGIGKVVRFGKLPVDFKIQAFSNVETPEGGADWSMMFSMKFLFLK